MKGSGRSSACCLIRYLHGHDGKHVDDGAFVREFSLQVDVKSSEADQSLYASRLSVDLNGAPLAAIEPISGIRLAYT